MNLKNSVNVTQNQIRDLTMSIAKMKAEINTYQRTNINTTLKSNIDYTSQNTVLKQRIAQIQGSINDAKRGIIRKSIFGDK